VPPLLAGDMQTMPARCPKDGVEIVNPNMLPPRSNEGDPCPRCCVPMQIREPESIGDRQQRQLFSYTRWFCCMNKQCKTTLVMPARYKVANVG
jgi:hypothetical protein